MALDFGFGDGSIPSTDATGGLWGGGAGTDNFGGGGFDFGALGGVVKGFGGLITGEMDADAAKEQAKAFHEAALQGREIAELEGEATTLEQYQEQRKLTKSLGEISAAQAANGFAEGGSGLYILADSARQGAVTQGKTGLQGAIEQDAAIMAANKSDAEAAAARASAKKSEAGGIMSGISGVFSLVSGIAGLL